jgi:O-antigen/teichoic acid export membrane protein
MKREPLRKRFKAGHLIQNAIALMVSSGGTAVLGVAFWATAAHLGSAENVGRATAEIAALSLLAFVAQLSFASIFDRFLPVLGKGTRKFVAHAYALTTGVALAAAIIYLLAGFGHEFIPTSFGWRALFVASVMLWTIFALQDSVLTGLRATRWVPVENILFALAKLALLPAALAITVGQGLFLAWTVPVVAATAGVNWYLFRKRIPEHEAINAAIEDVPSAREIASLAAAQFAQGLINFFTPSIVVLIVITRLGAVAEAHYYLPTLIAGGVATFLWNIVTSFLVEASRDPAGIRQHANATIKAALIVLLPTMLIGIALAPEILRIFGSAYATHGTALLRLQLLSLPGTAVTAFYSTFAWLDKRIWRLALRDLVLAASFFTLLFTFIGHFGLLAAGMASLTTSIFQLIFFLPIAIKRYQQTGDVETIDVTETTGGDAAPPAA